MTTTTPAVQHRPRQHHRLIQANEQLARAKGLNPCGSARYDRYSPLCHTIEAKPTKKGGFLRIVENVRAGQN